MFGVQFRPLTFEGVYGLPVVKKILQKSLEAQIYKPGYLFVGSFSSGKTTLSRIFARGILCENRLPDMSPCNECPSCKAFLENRHPGYLEIDAANNGTKDRIQEIKESLKYESIAGRKILLFDEAHNITKEGKDALLLQLENGDPNVIIIFCTTEVDKMPGSLRSRCFDFRLPEPTEKDIVQKMVKICEFKKFEYDIEALRLIVRYTGRHFRDAENKLDQASLLGPISLDNVKDVVTIYDEELAAMLLALPKDLSLAIKVSQGIITRMDVRQVYESILRLVNDALKLMHGVTFDSGSYVALLTPLKNAFGVVLFELLDYVLNKNRLNDLTMFQSDILILHYKFLKGGFKFKAFDVPEQVEQVKKRIEDQDEGRKILEDKSLQPWERDDKMREFKMKRLNTEKNEKVPEGVSKVWGPEKKAVVPEQPKKSKLSPEQFREIVGGNIESDRV
jgi:DNA polymerase III subunit gamma/tau